MQPSIAGVIASYRIAGGGGGGDAVAVNNQVGASFDGVGEGTTGSFSPGGANRAIFGGLVCIDYGSLATLTDFKYGGSGGTSLPKIGTDETFDMCSVAAFMDDSTPSGATTLWGDWSGTPFAAFVLGVALTGVNQTTQYAGATTAADPGGLFTTSTLASITITGMTPQQKAIAVLAARLDAGTGVSVTAGTDTTIPVQSIFAVGAAAILYGECQTGQTSVTLSATLAQGSENSIRWEIIGVRIVPA